MCDEPNSLDLAIKRIQSGWRIKNNGSGFLVYNDRKGAFSFHKTASSALTAYKANVFNHIFP